MVEGSKCALPRILEPTLMGDGKEWVTDVTITLQIARLNLAVTHESTCDYAFLSLCLASSSQS